GGRKWGGGGRGGRQPAGEGQGRGLGQELAAGAAVTSVFHWENSRACGRTGGVGWSRQVLCTLPDVALQANTPAERCVRLVATSCQLVGFGPAHKLAACGHDVACALRQPRRDKLTSWQLRTSPQAGSLWLRGRRNAHG